MTKRRYGEGSVEPRGDQRWRLRYRVGGQSYRVNFQGTISEAKRELRRLLKSGDDHQHVAPSKLTLEDWIIDWLRDRGVSERTRRRYSQLLNLHVVPTLGSHKLQTVTPIDIDKLYRSLTAISDRTRHHVHVVLSGCLSTAVLKGALVANPCIRADAPRATDSTAARVLDAKELAALVTGFRGHPLHGIVAVAAWTGARRNEILALRWGDIDLDAKTLRIERAIEPVKGAQRIKPPKTARGIRTIAIDDGLVALLRAEREKHLRLAAGIPDGASADLSLLRLPEAALVFPAPGDDLCKLRDANAITRTFQRKAKGLGFGHLRFHDLRGSHETMLLDAGVPVHTVAARCGHDAAVLLRAYAKRTAGSDSKAAAIIGELAGNAKGAV
jgi:integrase